jgi:ABC-type transport system substrate-binding protein
LREDSRRQLLARGVGTGAGLVSLPALLAACGSGNGGAATGGSGGKTLIVGLNSDVSSLDPHRALGWMTMIFTLAMGEHLVTEDLTHTGDGPRPLVPRLAESYEVSSDGLTYTYRLRDCVSFHDGTPFDAAAVEFSIRRQWDKSFEYFFAPAAGLGFWDYQFLKEIWPQVSISETHQIFQKRGLAGHFRARRGSRRGDSNPRPLRYEPRPLPMP